MNQYSEITDIIENLKSGRAHGPDNISNNILEDLNTIITSILIKIFHKILITEQIPSQWKESTIVLLFKKRDKANLSNYRPISLTPNLNKVFSNVEK